MVCQIPVKSGLPSLVRVIRAFGPCPIAGMTGLTRIGVNTAAPASRVASPIRAGIRSPIDLTIADVVPTHQTPGEGCVRLSRLRSFACRLNGLFPLFDTFAVESAGHRFIAFVTGVLVDLILAALHEQDRRPRLRPGR